jgi:hypothetical protein
MRQYVTGDNAPGYLPEGEPRGPWNGWEDAVRDLASLIEEDAENRLDDAEAMYEPGDERGEAQSFIRAELASAQTYGIEELRGHEDPRGADVMFMGRAFYIRPAEAGADD